MITKGFSVAAINGTHSNSFFGMCVNVFVSVHSFMTLDINDEMTWLWILLTLPPLRKKNEMWSLPVWNWQRLLLALIPSHFVWMRNSLFCDVLFCDSQLLRKFNQFSVVFFSRLSSRNRLRLTIQLLHFHMVMYSIRVAKI